MSEEFVERISHSSFPYELDLRLQNFAEDKIIHISSHNSFISFKNDLIFITRLIKPEYNVTFDEFSSNIPSFPLFRTSCVIKTSHVSVCGHLRCTCINQHGNLSNFAVNSNLLVLYFTSNLIVTYKLSWLPIDTTDGIGVDLVKFREFRAKRGSLSSLALDNSSDFIACSYFDSTTLIYNLDNVYRTFNVKNVVVFMRFNNKCLFSSTNQGEIYVYYLNENVTKSFQGHNSTVSDFCFLSFGGVEGFASSSFDSIINLYQLDLTVKNQQISESGKAPLKQFILSNALIGINVLTSESFDEALDTKSPWVILAVTENYSFQLIDPVTSASLKKVNYESSAKRVFFFDTFFAIFTNSCEIDLYHMRSLKFLYSICCNFDKCYYVRVISEHLIGSQDNNLMLFTLNGDEKARLVARDNLQVVLYKHQDIILSADMFQEFVVTGSKDGSMAIYDMKQRRVICSTCASKNGISSVAIFKQSNCVNVVTADYENILKIWSGVGELLHITIPHKKTINHISISPNHKMIATASSDKIVKLFNNKLELLGTCTGHAKSVNYSIFIEKDMVLVTASNDSLIKCWNVKNFECIKTFQGHEDSVLVLSQLNDFYIASGDVLGFIKIWSIRNCLCYHTVQPYKNKIWHMNLSLPFLVTCGEEDSVLVWRFSEGTRAISPSKERIKNQMEIDALLASNDFASALYLCIKLDLPFKFLEVLTMYSEKLIFARLSDRPLESISGSNLIDVLFKKIIESKGSEEFGQFITSLCHLIRVCVTNAKISNIGNLLLNSLLKNTDYQDLGLIFANLKLDELSLLQSKHYNRIFQMAEKSWLLDLLVLDCGDLQVSKTMQYLNHN